MRAMLRLAMLVVMGAVLLGVGSVGAARLNTDTVLFGTILPSPTAAPGSCLTLTAIANELLQPGDTTANPSTFKNSASYTRVCPSASASAPTPFALLFSGVPANSTPSQLLSVNITAIQPAAGPSPAELRSNWAVGVAPGAAASLSLLDMTLAERHPLAHTSPKRTSKPSAAPKTATSPSNASLEAGTAHVCSPPALTESAPAAPGAVPAAVATLVALMAGVAVGKASKSRKKAAPVTCEVACSPFPAAALRRRSKALSKWSRDHEGRLQREGGADNDNEEEMEAPEE